MMVVACDFPADSALDRRMVDAAYFRDSYRAPLRRAQRDMVGIFFDLFGHHPSWIKALLVTRNRIAATFGLAVPKAADILHPTRKASYRIGDTIGPWPVFHLTDHELVAGPQRGLALARRKRCWRQDPPRARRRVVRRAVGVE